jgi:Protein of unknown function (DUF3574)
VKRVQANHGKPAVIGYAARRCGFAENRFSPVAQLLGRAGNDLGPRLRFFHQAIIASQLLLSGCASLPQACLPPARAMISAEMFFGRSVGSHVVSEHAFAAFLATEFTPRFPDGLTVIDARGQWRNDQRSAIIREPSKLVKIVFADEAQKRADLDAIAESYKRKFHQQSVLIALQPACVTF